MGTPLDLVSTKNCAVSQLTAVEFPLWPPHLFHHHPLSLLPFAQLLSISVTCSPSTRLPSQNHNTHVLPLSLLHTAITNFSSALDSLVPVSQLFTPATPSLGSHTPFAISAYTSMQLTGSGREKETCSLTFSAINSYCLPSPLPSAWLKQHDSYSLIHSNSRDPYSTCSLLSIPSPSTLLATQDFAAFSNQKIIVTIHPELADTLLSLPPILPPYPPSSTACFPTVSNHWR